MTATASGEELRSNATPFKLLLCQALPASLPAQLGPVSAVSTATVHLCNNLPLTRRLIMFKKQLTTLIC
jgi:hypothetical protein